jgi:SPP1 gp7 family putative phage head morphogenesis protein
VADDKDFESGSWDDDDDDDDGGEDFDFSDAPDSLDEDDFDDDTEWFADATETEEEKKHSLLSELLRLAGTVAAVGILDLFSDAWDSIESAEKRGDDQETFSSDVSEKLEDMWGGDEPSALQTIFSTNGQSQFSDGRTDDRDTIIDDFPYDEFVAVLDEVTTEICEECDGTILPANDPWWDTHTPDLHFNCRSQRVPVTETEAADKGGIDTHGPDQDAGEGFGNPYQDWDPDLTTRPPELVEVYHSMQKDEDGET